MTKGTVIAPHHLAAQAGQDVLARGGNAIEAVVAAGAALAVVYPHFCGIGGDAVWLVSDAAGRVDCYLGIGQAGRVVDRIEQRGPQSMLTTAALVDSWDSLLAHSAEWGGQETLAALLQPAIDHAENGFDVSASQRFWHDFRRGEAAGFLREGLQRQPDLARTLRLIARDGARSFYEGALADRIAAGLAAVGAPLTPADLAATRTQRVEPLRLDYRGLTLCAPPPPTQGVTTLEIMGILGAFDMAGFAPDSAEYYHHLVEGVKQAFLDRPTIADPRFAQVNVTALLGKVKHAAARIDPARAMPWPQPWQHGDTAFLAATDAQGRTACVLQTLYFDWGSGVVVGDTGILWQNRGAAFTLQAGHPNRMEVGKRPFYTLNPGIALKDGRPHLVYGTQGADGQPQTLALLLSLLIDHGMSPTDALAHPRFLLGRTFSDANDTLKIEAGLPDATTAQLAAMGHEVCQIEAFSQLGGHAGIIHIGDSAAHDPRSDWKAPCSI